MRADRFDDLTRALAIRPSRRTVFKTLVGGLAGGTLAALGWGGAAAQSSQSCADACRRLPAGAARDACLRACNQAPLGAFGQFCGGIAGIPCPAGFTCIDDPRDDCNPATGGADCGGICIPG